MKQADMIDYKSSNNKGFRYVFVKIDIDSKFLWAIPLKNKSKETITDEFSNCFIYFKTITIQNRE